MTQMEAQVDKAEPLSASLKTVLIPEIAVKMVVGGKYKKEGDQVTLVFEGDTVVMHEEDFDLAKRVADRLLYTIPGRKITPGVVITAVGNAHRITVEEVFSGKALRVLYYPVMAEASAWYRCVIPSLVLNSNGNIHSYVTRTRIPREAMDFDVIVFQLDFAPVALKFAKAMQAMGKKVVYEIDDALDALEPWHRSYEHFQKNGTQDQVKAMIKNADLLTVTTPYLAERYGQYAKKVAVIPNCVTMHDWPKAEKNTDGTFRVVWAGSPSHWGDLSDLSKVLVNFAKEHKDARLVFFGRKPVGLEEVESQVEFHEWVSFAEFPQKLADLKGDVAIAPLSDVPFNHAKSNLRLIQYGATGYPIIASAVGQYLETGKTFIPLCKTPTEWREALEFHYANPSFRDLMAKKAMEFAQQYDINVHAKNIEKVYLSLVGR